MAKKFTVREQWPHRVVKEFDTLAEAQAWLDANRASLALPIITSREA